MNILLQRPRGEPGRAERKRYVSSSTTHHNTFDSGRLSLCLYLQNSLKGRGLRLHYGLPGRRLLRQQQELGVRLCAAQTGDAAVQRQQEGNRLWEAAVPVSQAIQLRATSPERETFK